MTKGCTKNNDIYILKPSGVIQIVLTDSKKLTLSQRKAWNILILNAREDLDNSGQYKICFCTLSALLGNNDISHLKKDLLQLMITPVQFNYLKTRDKTVWEAATLLADARISDNVLCYTISPVLREKLKNTEFCALINLAVQQNIDSKYSLILYELAKDHCKASQNRGNTPFIPVEDLKKILGCDKDKNYEQFKEFSRLLKRSIEEINEKSDITIEAIYKRNGKSVGWVKFQIKENNDILADAGGKNKDGQVKNLTRFTNSALKEDEPVSAAA